MHVRVSVCLSVCMCAYVYMHACMLACHRRPEQGWQQTPCTACAHPPPRRDRHPAAAARTCHIAPEYIYVYIYIYIYRERERERESIHITQTLHTHTNVIYIHICINTRAYTQALKGVAEHRRAVRLEQRGVAVDGMRQHPSHVGLVVLAHALEEHL